MEKFEEKQKWEQLYSFIHNPAIDLKYYNDIIEDDVQSEAVRVCYLRKYIELKTNLIIEDHCE